MSKKPKRNKEKFPGLKHSVNSKNRQHLIDHDYIHKLNDEEKAWLSKFNEEYISGTFDKVDNENNFHKTQDEKRECWRRNNSRNRCAMTISSSTCRLVYLGFNNSSDFKEYSAENQYHEPELELEKKLLLEKSLNNKTNKSE